MNNTAAPAITNAAYSHRFTLALTFDDGTENNVDLTLWLHKKGFEDVRRMEVFRKFTVEDGKLTWPNGASVDTASLYQRAKSQARPKVLALSSPRGRKGF